jgi:hypothetical protein
MFFVIGAIVIGIKYWLEITEVKELEWYSMSQKL